MLRRSLSTFFCAALIACSAQAHEYQIGQLHIDHPWARALPPVAPTGAAYLRIENQGNTPDSLVSAHSPVADKVEMHEHVHVDGLMKMQRTDQVPLSPGDNVTFEPGGYHFMLFGLNQPLVAGDAFPLTLLFRDAGSIEVQVMVSEQEPEAVDHSAHSAAEEHDAHQHH